MNLYRNEDRNWTIQMTEIKMCKTFEIIDG